MKSINLLLVIAVIGCSVVYGEDSETLPALKDGQAPKNFEQMWAGFDPRA